LSSPPPPLDAADAGDGREGRRCASTSRLRPRVLSARSPSAARPLFADAPLRLIPILVASTPQMPRTLTVGKPVLRLRGRQGRRCAGTSRRTRIGAGKEKTLVFGKKKSDARYVLPQIQVRHEFRLLSDMNFIGFPFLYIADFVWLSSQISSTTCRGSS